MQKLDEVLTFQPKQDQSVKQVVFIDACETIVKRVSRDRKRFNELQIHVFMKGTSVEKVIDKLRQILENDEADEEEIM